MLGPVLVLSALDVTNDWKRTMVGDPELAAYVRTELGGDLSRITIPEARRSHRPTIWARLRYAINTFRGSGVLDLRSGRS